MIDDFKNLELEDNFQEEKIDLIIKEKLNISLLQMKEAICNFVLDKAEDLIKDFHNIIPHGQYDKIIYDQDEMIDFLKSDGANVEYWKLESVIAVKDKPVIEFCFACQAVDEGEELKGYVFVSNSGQIRHAFAQSE